MPVTSKNPCKGCERRTAECHPVCEDYAEFKRHKDAIREQKHKDQAASPELSEARKKHISKMIRERRRYG